MKTLISLFCLLPALAFAQKVEYPGGVNSNQVYNIIQSIGINGVAVSNQVSALTVASFYTNATPHYAEVHATVSMTGTSGYARAAVTNTAANTRFFVYDTPSFSVGAVTNTLVFVVPPSNHYKIDGVGMTVGNGAQVVMYLSTNSGSAGSGSGDVTQSGLAAGSYAQRSAIFIYGTNGTTRNFSNNIQTAFASLTSGDRLVLPEGDFTVGLTNLVINADAVTVKGAGSATRIISWAAGCAIIPGTNNTTLEDFTLTYDWLPQQLEVVASENDSWSQGIGTPSHAVANYIGNISLADRGVTNLVGNRITVRSQSDNVTAFTTNAGFIANFNDCTFLYAYDSFAMSGSTQYLKLRNCHFEFVNDAQNLFTNSAGSSIGQSPKMFLLGQSARLDMSGCSGRSVAPVTAFLSSDAVNFVSSSSFLLTNVGGSYSFVPSVFSGDCVVNGIHYTGRSGNYSQTNIAPTSLIDPSTWPTTGQLRTNGNQRSFANIQFSMQTDLAAGQADITLVRWLIGTRTNSSVITLTDTEGGLIKFGQLTFFMSPGEVWMWSAVETGDVLETRISDSTGTSSIQGL